MKQGDLVMYKCIINPLTREDVWVILNITKNKKTWHRQIILYNSGGLIAIPWSDRTMLEVIQ